MLSWGSNTVSLLGAEVAPIVVLLFLGEIALVVAFAIAWTLARLHQGRYHQYVMLSAFTLDMVIFKPLMITRALNAYGSYPWHGTNIAIHLWFDIPVIALGFLAIYLGLTRRIKKNGKLFMPSKGRIHRIFGYTFLAFWGATFVIGVTLFIRAYVG